MVSGSFKESAKSFIAKWNFKKYLFRLLLLGIVLLVSWGSFAVFANYSNGVRAGVIQKFSKKGYVFKTWEGQLFQGTTVPGYAGNATPLSGTIWDFSVDCNNKEVVDAINKALISGKRVTLHYKEKYYKFSWRGDTKYFIFKVDEI
jgi:hypothetical protein